MIFKFFQLIAWFVSRFLGIVFLGIKFEGQENLNISDETKIIYIANHQGYFDPFLISCGVPLKKFSKKTLRFMTVYYQIIKRWYGFGIWLCGAYPVYPKLKSLEVSLKKTIKILKTDQDVLMFPAGKLLSDFSTCDARPGIAYLAKELNPVIVPVYISGTYKLGFFEFFMRKRKVVIKFGKPFYYKEKTKEEKDLIKMAADISEAIKELEK